MIVLIIEILIGADSLVGSVPTYSTIALWASQVRIPASKTFPNPTPSLSLFASGQL